MVADGYVRLQRPWRSIELRVAIVAILLFAAHGVAPESAILLPLGWGGYRKGSSDIASHSLPMTNRGVK